MVQATYYHSFEVYCPTSRVCIASVRADVRVAVKARRAEGKFSSKGIYALAVPLFSYGGEQECITRLEMI